MFKIKSRKTRNKDRWDMVYEEPGRSRLAHQLANGIGCVVHGTYCPAGLHIEEMKDILVKEDEAYLPEYEI